MNNDPGAQGETSPELAPSCQQPISRDDDSEELLNPAVTEALEGSTYEEGDVSIDVPPVPSEEDTGSPSG